MERRRRKQPQAFHKSRFEAAQLALARIFSGTEGVTTLACSPSWLHNSDAGVQSLVLQLKRSKPTARAAARGSFEHRGDNRSVCVRLIQAKRRTKLMLSQELRALNSFERKSADRLKF